MANNPSDWPVSQTGGAKMTGKEATEILRVSYTHLYTLIERGDLLRAEPRNKAFRKQPLVFFRADVVNLAREYGTISEEQANKLLHQNQAGHAQVSA